MVKLRIDESLDYSFSAILVTSQQMDGTIKAGKKMKGQIAYEVDKDWKTVEIEFAPVWLGETLLYKINNK